MWVDIKKLKLVSRSTTYDYDNGSIVMEKNPRMTPTSNHISVKYHWFRKPFGKKFLIWKIESENQKANIFTKGLQGQIFVRISKLLLPHM